MSDVELTHLFVQNYSYLLNIVQELVDKLF